MEVSLLVGGSLPEAFDAGGGFHKKMQPVTEWTIAQYVSMLALTYVSKNITAPLHHS